MHHSSIELLQTFERTGMRLWLMGNQLHYCAPKGVLTPALRENLTAQRDTIAAALLESRVSSADIVPPVVQRSPSSLAPLAFQQIRTWRLLELVKGFNAVNYYALELLGSLDVAAISRAFEQVAARHDALRTTIVHTSAGPKQRVNPGVPVALEPVDLSENVSVPEPLKAARSLIDAFFSAGIDVKVSLPLKAKLVRLAHSRHVLGVGLHSIVTDAISVTIFFRELWEIYCHYAYGEPINLPNSPVQYPDYAISQRSAYSVWESRHRSYWTKKLRAAKSLQLPLVQWTDVTPHASGIRTNLRFSRPASTALRRLAIQERTTTSLAVLAVFATAAAQLFEQQDFIIAVAVAGRDSSIHDDMIGGVAYRLYLRIDLRSSATFIDVLRMITREYLAAWEHRDNGTIMNERPELGRTRFEYLSWRPSDQISAPSSWRASTGRLQVVEFPFEAIQLPSSWHTEPTRIDLNLTFYEDSGDIVGNIWTGPLVCPDIPSRLSHQIRILGDSVGRVPYQPLTDFAQSTLS